MHKLQNVTLLLPSILRSAVVDMVKNMKDKMVAIVVIQFKMLVNRFFWEKMF